MENLTQNNPETTTSNAMLSQLSVQYLLGTAPWMKFFSILGFIMCGFMVLAAFIGLVSGSAYGGIGGGVGVFIVYIIMAIVIYFPNKYLYNYAIGIRDFNISNDNSLIEKSFLMQKKYWKYMGVLVIIYLSFAAIALIAFILGDIY